MSHAKLDGTDLRGSEIEGIFMVARDAHGLVVEPMQTLHLAPLLGIRVVPRTEELELH